MPEKTEKRLKLTDKDFLNSEKECDGTLLVMDGREKEAERLFEDALDQSLAIFELSDSQIEVLEKESDFDEMRLHEFYKRNPPAKKKTTFTEHGSFGMKTEAAKYNIETGEDSFQKAMKRAEELEEMAAKNSDATIKKMLLAEAKIIRDSFSRAVEMIQKIKFAIIRKYLKSLSEETLCAIGVEVIPETEKFFTQIGSGTRSVAKKAIAALIASLKKNQDSAA